MAGDKNPYVEAAPMPAPTLYDWFAGASVGYLFENEEEMYPGHFGRELHSQLGRWDQSIFLEVGYSQWDDSSHYYYDDS